MILISGDFSDRLMRVLAEGAVEYLIASAFIKLDSLKTLSEHFSPQVDSVSVVARWQKHDLVMGASDIEVYEYCRDNGWRFGVDQSLHGKLYMVDRKTVLLGSANLTNRGLAFGQAVNMEVGTELSVDEIDLVKLDSFLTNQVTWLDDESYSNLVSEVKASKEGVLPIHSIKWSDEMSALLAKEVKLLWVDDLLFKTPNDLLVGDFDDDGVCHDFELLGLDVDDITHDAIVRAFRRTKVYSWIVSQLAEHGPMRFGHLSSVLHDSIMNEPAPYRKEVKEFVRCLFEWCEFVGQEFVVTKYERTSALELEALPTQNGDSG